MTPLTSILAIASLLLLAVAGLLIGLGVGMLVRSRGLMGMATVSGIVLGLFAGILHYSFVKQREVEARRGWNLVPVVVAAVDVAPGTTLTFDMISQRSVPEQFVTRDIVKPDSASYVVNQQVVVKLEAGDLLQWSQFCAVTPESAQIH